MTRPTSKLWLLLCLLASALCFPAFAQSPAASGTILTIAGNGSGGFSGDGGPATNASLNAPHGLAIGPDGTLYFADNGNFRFRAIAPATGLIRTMAGNGQTGDIGDANGDGGPATNASFSSALTIAVDRARHALYCTDFPENRVRKVNLTNGLISNYAGIASLFSSGFSGDGGPATSAQFFSPESVAVDGAGRLSIGDVLNYRIRQVHPVTGIITTIAGNGNNVSAGDGGPATNASFTYTRRVAADRAGNVFVLDESDTNRIRRVDAATGIITTVAGGGTNVPGTGPATSMNLTDLRDLAVSDDRKLFLANSTRVFVVDLAAGQLTPFAGDGIPGFGGDGGPALNARFGSSIAGLTLAPGGGLLISDAGNQRIRYVVPDSITLTNDSGQTAFYLPWVSALSGNLVIEDNANLEVIDLSSLESAGNITITDNEQAATVSLGSLVTASGDITITDNGQAATVSLGSLVTASGDITITDNEQAATVSLGSLVTASGDITIEDNAPDAVVDFSSLTTYGCGATTVTMTLNGGTVLVPGGLTICTNATLNGSSTVDGSITNNGNIEPGRSPGRLNLTGRLVLAGNSKLRLEVGGYTPGSQFDFVQVAGAVTLGGTLAVSLVNNFPGVMTNGASFTVLTAGSPLTGAFANVASGGTLTTTDGAARFTVLYAGGSTVRLTNLEILDTDGDGALDADELAAGTNPNDPASVFRILSLQPEAGGARLTWSTVGGKSYVVQTNGSLTAPFADFSPLIPVPGTGESTTNHLDGSGATGAARYYRVRLGP